MSYLRQRENIKVCPGCGTNLINTARHCAVCGYLFTDEDLRDQKEDAPAKHLPGQRIPAASTARLVTVSLNLPVILGMILLIAAANILVILGLLQRDENRLLLESSRATATYIATTYVSPTPSPTATSTPGPPTATPVVDLEYTVVAGDSCISIAHQFNLYLDSLLAKNKDLDCANVTIGMVLRIPQPTPTPVPTSTATVNPAP